MTSVERTAYRVGRFAKAQPGMLVKRHFEAMVFAYLAEELRAGDIAVDGAAEYGDWSWRWPR